MFTLTVTASAFSIFDDVIMPDNVMDDIRGTAPITAGDACYLYRQYTGCTAEVVNSQCVFVEDDERLVVWVYDTSGVQQDAICYNADGMIYSYGLNYAVSGSGGGGGELRISDEVSIVFDIASKAFDFLMFNPLIALCLGVSFGFTGFTLIRKGMRTAKRV